MSDLSYDERAENIMPKWCFWGEGIVLLKKEDYYKSRVRIVAILKQLGKAKNKLKEQK